MSKPAVEIRPNDDGSIDEIIAKDCAIHIEQMSDDGWFMGIDAADGSYWQFWFGSKNRKSHVEFRHTEMIPAPTDDKTKEDCRAKWPHNLANHRKPA